MLQSIHHVALICSDYVRSKHFYTQILGLEVLQEVYRSERESFKLDLALHGQYVLELFSFPNPPARPTQPEACGLRHLAFAVDQLDAVVLQLQEQGINTEPVRVDAYTGKRFTFLQDPDGLPIELYER
jgi:glyoxylase I family protein